MDNHLNEQNNEEWNTYQTGNTEPPKKHGGLLALLLISIIFLGGIASALGVSNARLHRQLKRQEAEEVPLAFSPIDTTETTMPDFIDAIPLVTASELDIEIQKVPGPQDNIPQPGGLSLQEIYKKIIPSVVSITCTRGNSTVSGTGVVLSSDGYIVTNSHVVEGARHIQVLITGRKPMEATLVGADTLSDLAVLHVEMRNLTPAEFGDSSAVQVGDLAVAVGDPLGVELRGTMTDGIISAISRDISTGSRTMTLLQTNAALNSGNSGGPLLNCHGQVIGINTMKIGDYVSSVGVEGLGFAIPSTTVKEVVDELMDQGYVSGRPTLGLKGEPISILFQNLYHLPEGIYITEVDPMSYAARVGIQPGDILLSMDGSRITSLDVLESVLFSHKDGDMVTVTVSRAGESYETVLKLSCTE